MKYNDVLKRLRYTFDFNDKKMMQIFGLGGSTFSREEISNWMKKEEDEQYVEIKPSELAAFLNGLIIKNRGARDGGPPEPEKNLNNNMILQKVKIALSLTTEDIIEMFILIDRNIGKHELTAFLRNPKQNQYRIFKDQYLRYFMNAVQHKYRPKEGNNNISI